MILGNENYCTKALLWPKTFKLNDSPDEGADVSSSDHDAKGTSLCVIGFTPKALLRGAEVWGTREAGVVQ